MPRVPDGGEAHNELIGPLVPIWPTDHVASPSFTINGDPTFILETVGQVAPVLRAI